MPEFLQLFPPADALALLRKHLPAIPRQGETILAMDAAGRVTAQPIIASEPLPAFSRSTVDGFAVRARDTFGASDSLPVYLSLAGEVPMGKSPSFVLQVQQAATIHTGGMLPEGCDSVVMLEHTQLSRPGEVEILRAAAPGENILHAGEDAQIGDEVISAGRLLRPAEIGGLAALGILDVTVVPRPRVGILSSGDEVVPPEVQVSPGQVRDINSYTLSALVEAHGGAARRYGIIPDRLDAMREAMRRALQECSLVVVTAGSSASTRDLTAQVIAEMGQPGVLVHGVNVKPGKPTILGVCGGKAVIGLPGNPVSALVIARLFVVPVLEHLLGLSTSRPEAVIAARLSANVPSQAGREDYVPVKLVRDQLQILAEPVFYKSNLIFNLASADGLLRIPADATGLSVGSQVEVILLV